MKLNQIQIIGRIGREAEIKTYQDRQFLVFSVAVDEGYTDGHGRKVERKTWFSITTSQERFFKVAEWLTKGREVFVEGRPIARTYPDSEGKIQAEIRIELQNISLGQPPKEKPLTVATPAPAATSATPAPFSSGSGNDDDLPF